MDLSVLQSCISSSDLKKKFLKCKITGGDSLGIGTFDIVVVNSVDLSCFLVFDKDYNYILFQSCVIGLKKFCIITASSANKLCDYDLSNGIILTSNRWDTAVYHDVISKMTDDTINLVSSDVFQMSYDYFRTDKYDELQLIEGVFDGKKYRGRILKKYH